MESRPNLLSRMFISVLALGLASQSQAQLSRSRITAEKQDPNLPTSLGSVFDDTYSKDKLKIRRVAVIPNRMPLFLTEADMWRRYNWQILSGMFLDRGYDVVDFETTVAAFRRSNLPMEDTGSSEAKFARLARTLKADILVMPYYGTGFQNTMIVVASMPTYISLVTLQIYSADDNKFIYRSDQTGKSSYFQGWAMVGMLIGFVLPDIETTEDIGFGQTITYSEPNPGRIILPIAGLGADLAQALVPPKKRWEKAFLKADRAALEPFFATYPGPTAKVKKKKASKKTSSRKTKSSKKRSDKGLGLEDY